MDPAFVADAMLGRLAKWLRLIGADTVYIRDAEDEALVRIALEEDRTLLTRDGPLAAHKMLRGRTVFIESERTFAQLRQVMRHFGLQVTDEALFTRCIVCNTPIEPVDKASVRGRVPPYVFSTQECFGYCRTCNKIYWRGTHADHVVSALNGASGSMEVLEAITKRRSIRSFRSDPVPDDIIEEIVAAGFCAPSADGRSPWHVVVVRDPEKRRRLADTHQWSHFVAQAPVILVVVVDRDVSENCWIEDGSALMMNILLAAESRGLGSCWVAVRSAIYGEVDAEEIARDILGIPARFGVLGMTPIGYSKDDQPPHQLISPRGQVHKDRFSG